MQDTTNNSPEPTIPTTTKYTCSASCHMRGMTFAVYDVCRSVSAKSGKMYCSAEFIAGRYIGMSQSTVYKHLKILQSQGWIVLTKARTWLADGTTSTNQFRVLKHEEWALAYPGKCEPPVKKTKNRPSLKTGEGSQPSPIGGVTFTNLRSHLHSELVSNLKEPNLKERTLKNTSGIAKPSLNLGEGGIAYGQQTGNPSHRMAQPSPGLSEGCVHTEVDALTERFSRRRRKKVPLPLDPQSVAPAPNAPPAITPENLATAVAKKLGNTLDSAQWEVSFRRLTAKGHDGETLRTVFRHYINTCDRDLVRRERAAGFEVAFDRLLAETMDSERSAA